MQQTIPSVILPAYGGRFWTRAQSQYCACGLLLSDRMTVSYVTTTTQTASCVYQTVVPQCPVYKTAVLALILLMS